MADEDRRAPAGEKKRKRTAWSCITVLLRLLQLTATVCSFSVLVTSPVNGISWKQYQGFKFLLSGTVIAAAWALLMLACDLVNLCTGRRPRIIASLTVLTLGDWVAMLLTYGAGCAGAGLTTFNDQGAFPYRQAACEGSTPFDKFCSRTKASVALAFIAFFFFLPSVVWSCSELAYAWAETRTEKNEKGKSVQMT